MAVRDMKGNPGIWEQLSWADMSSEEQGFWTELGWREDKWDRNEAPPSAAKEWKDLSYVEQYAAKGLGFTEDMWDGFEDQ